MGQLVQKPTQVQYKQKTLIVQLEEADIEILIPNCELTTGWLLSEVTRRYLGRRSIVALSTADGLEILDYWLILLTTSLHPFSDRQLLLAVFKEEVEGPVNGSHFQPIKTIGKGAFSVVILARKKDTGKLYAVKSIKKSLALTRYEQIISERKILGELDHPFVVKLHWVFQSDDYLHLVLDFCPGGELFYHLQRIGKLSEESAKFYFCEVLLAIDCLHSQSIVYRDLKPENILVDLDGHVKLTDFGLAKRLRFPRARTRSFCGSPEYMSPEMLMKKEHGREVDHYSLGALLFEMLTGLPPHYHPDPEVMHEMILHQDLNLPRNLSRELRLFLISLLHKDVNRRMGSKNGIAEIKCHPWLRDVNWNSIRNKMTEPPIRPLLKTSNFEPELSHETVEWETQNVANDATFDSYCLDSPKVHRQRTCDIQGNAQFEWEVPDLYSKQHAQMIATDDFREIYKKKGDKKPLNKTLREIWNHQIKKAARSNNQNSELRKRTLRNIK